MALHLKSTGIDFTDFGQTSQSNSSMVSELLDDYEEGTWTPTMFGNSAVELSLSTGNGNYNKQSALVYLVGNCIVTNTNSAAGHVYVYHMPFASRSQGSPGWGHGGFVNSASGLDIGNDDTVTFANEPGNVNYYMYLSNAAGTGSMSPAAVSADGAFNFNCQYLVA